MPVISHKILRSPENTVLPVLQSISDGVGEGFVVSSYQPVQCQKNSSLRKEGGGGDRIHAGVKNKSSRSYDGSKCNGMCGQINPTHFKEVEIHELVLSIRFVPFKS